MARLLVGGVVALAVVVRVKKVEREPTAIVQQGGALLEGGFVLVVVLPVDLALQRAGVAYAVAQAHVYHGAAHLVACRGVVHHVHPLYAAGGHGLQQGVELFGGHVGHLAVQHDGHAARAQAQPAVHLGHAGQLLQGVVNVVHGLVLNDARQVVLQPPGAGFHHGAFARHHHLGQRAVEAVHVGIARGDAVGREGAFAGLGGSLWVGVLGTQGRCTEQREEEVKSLSHCRCHILSYLSINRLMFPAFPKL